MLNASCRQTSSCPWLEYDGHGGTRHGRVEGAAHPQRATPARGWGIRNSGTSDTAWGKVGRFARRRTWAVARDPAEPGAVPERVSALYAPRAPPTRPWQHFTRRAHPRHARGSTLRAARTSDTPVAALCVPRAPPTRPCPGFPDSGKPGHGRGWTPRIPGSLDTGVARLFKPRTHRPRSSGFGQKCLVAGRRCGEPLCWGETQRLALAPLPPRGRVPLPAGATPGGCFILCGSRGSTLVESCAKEHFRANQRRRTKALVVAPAGRGTQAKPGRGARDKCCVSPQRRISTHVLSTTNEL